jgi:hypothetical protein
MYLPLANSSCRSVERAACCCHGVIECPSAHYPHGFRWRCEIQRNVNSVECNLFAHERPAITSGFTYYEPDTFVQHCRGGIEVGEPCGQSCDSQAIGQRFVELQAGQGTFVDFRES